MYPSPEAAQGWAWLDRDGARDVAGFDVARLDVVERSYSALFAGDSSSVVIVRGGRLVREFHAFNVGHAARFDIWSGTKSFTATAWMLALARVASGQDTPALATDGPLTLATPAYSLLPAGLPLSDPRKAQITLRHLLSMTSGIAGEKSGIAGMPNATGAGIVAFKYPACP